MGYRAVIFSLEGVICDTGEYHYRAWKEMADSIGIPFDRDLAKRISGLSREAGLETILSEAGVSLSAAEKEELSESKNEQYKRYLSHISPSDLRPGVRKTLEELRGRGALLGVVSHSRNAAEILNRIGMDSIWDSVCDGNMLTVTDQRPARELLVKSTQSLSTEPSACLAVVGSADGLQAGHDAGMDVALVGDTCDSEWMREYPRTVFLKYSGGLAGLWERVTTSP